MICRNLTKENNIEKMIDKAIPIIFDFDYPVYNKETKERLERLIITNYFTREISAETYGLWKFWLKTRLNTIMPYYNELYKTVDLDFDPLSDSKYTISKKYTETISGKTKSDTINKNSDTPQGGLDGLLNDKYVSSASVGNDNGSSESKRDFTDSQTIDGKIGHQTYSSMLREYRDTILNIDLMVIKELEDLFFQLW